MIKFQTIIRFKFLVFSSLLILHPGKSFSQTILRDSTNHYWLQEILALEDPEGKLTLAEVLQKEDSFKEYSAPLSFGITQSVYWFKFSLTNESEKIRWFLEIGNTYFYEVDLYQVFPGGKVLHKQSGTGRDFDQRFIKTNQLILPLNLEPGNTGTLFLRLKTRLFMRPNVQVASMQALYEFNHIEDILNGIYFGLLVAMMAYNLFVYISIRDITYLFYVLYTFFLSLHVVNIKGYGEEFLWGREVLLNSSHIWISLGIFFAILFTNSFLHTKQYVPKLYKFQWVVFLTIILSLVLSFIGFEAAGFMLLAFNPAYVYYVFIMGIAVYRKGFEPAKYYVFGFGVLVTGILFFELVEFGLIPSNLVTEHLLQLGSSVEAIVLSYALAAKLNFYKKEKEEAQNKALQQAKGFSQQLIQSQEHERKRIAGELHDSIGQSLILIKNKILLFKKQDDQSGNGNSSDLTDMVTDTIQEVRAISYGLRPFQLDLLGLTNSIHELVEETEEGSGIKFKENIEPIDGVLSKDNEINLYRIIQECLNNIVKHSGAKEAAIFIRKKQNSIEISIEDYGVGIVSNGKVTDHTHGFGFLGIKERLNILGGTMVREKAIPSGTSINIILPTTISYEKN